MRYIVSGYRRSGTSMMMRVMAALLMPKIKLIMYREFETSNLPIDGYSPAPTGLLEVGRGLYMNPKWLRNFANDRLIKAFYEGLPYLPGRKEGAGYNIVFMRRNPEEIKQSVERAEQYLEELQEKSGHERVRPDRHGWGFDVFNDYDEEDINHVLSICHARKDITLFEVQFTDMIENTEETIRKLAEDLPEEISEEKIKEACRQVNPTYRRYQCA